MTAAQAGELVKSPMVRPSCRRLEGEDNRATGRG